MAFPNVKKEEKHENRYEYNRACKDCSNATTATINFKLFLKLLQVVASD
jgi:hypothetical protein